MPGYTAVTGATRVIFGVYLDALDIPEQYTITVQRFDHGSGTYEDTGIVSVPAQEAPVGLARLMQFLADHAREQSLF